MKRNIISYIITIVTALALISCAAGQPAKQTQTANAKTAVFSGTISGIKDGGRAAGIDLSGLKWRVSASKNISKEEISTGGSQTINAAVNGSSWSVELPLDGTSWNIEAEGFITDVSGDKKIYRGSKDVTADARTAAQSVKIPVSIIGNQGSFHLKIQRETDKIKRVYIKIDGFTKPSIEANFDENNIAHYDPYRINAGSHLLTFEFTDNEDATPDGNVLYRCKETVTVYAGCVTNKWLGNSSYFTTDASGDKVMFITDAMISAYGTECVPSTGIVLYDVTYDGGFGEDRLIYTFNGKEYKDYKPGEADFCFDESGDLFLFDCKATKNIFTTKMNSNSIDLNNCFDDNHPSDNLSEIAYDIAQKENLYVRNNNYFYLIDIQASEERYLKYTYILEEVEEIQCFAVNNNIIYAVADGKLIIAGMRDDTTDDQDRYLFTVDNSADLDWVDMGFCREGEYFSPDITDLLYQDGCVYMLVKEERLYSQNDMTFYARGAVIKYNCFDGSVTSFGLSSEPIDNDDKYLYAYHKSDNQLKTANDTNPSAVEIIVKASDIKYSKTDKQLFNLYSPETIYSDGDFSFSEEGFYGPIKFVGIKPKKLVIADDGVAFYTDENGAYQLTNVNRVVTVDLESFAKMEQLEVCDVEFASRYSNGSGFIRSNASLYAFIEEGTSVYTTDDKTEAYTECLYWGTNGEHYASSAFGPDGYLQPVIKVPQN